MSVDNLSGLTDKQKKKLKEIRSETREDPYAKEATATTSKKEPLKKLTDGVLEEVVKLKALNDSMSIINKREGEKIGRDIINEQPFKGSGKERSEYHGRTKPDTAGTPDTQKKVDEKWEKAKPKSATQPKSTDSPTDKLNNPSEIDHYNKPSKARSVWQKLLGRGKKDKPTDYYTGKKIGGKKIGDKVRDAGKKITDIPRNTKQTARGLNYVFGRGKNPNLKPSSNSTPRPAPAGTPPYKETEHAPFQSRSGTSIFTGSGSGKRNAIGKDGNGYGNLFVANIMSSGLYNDETYIGKPEMKQETYILNNESKNNQMNKITKTKIGDHINFYVNGVEGNGVISKMSGSFVTIFKEDGKFYEIPITDTFFVKDIIVNKTWDNMDMEEKTIALIKIHAYSPRFLAKTWTDLPVELRTVLTKSNVEHGSYGSAGGNGLAGVNTNIPFDADDMYEAVDLDLKNSFQHDEDIPKNEDKKKDDGISTSTSGTFNPVYNKKKKYFVPEQTGGTWGIRYDKIDKDINSGEKFMPSTPKKEGQSHGEQSAHEKIGTFYDPRKIQEQPKLPKTGNAPIGAKDWMYHTGEPEEIPYISELDNKENPVNIGSDEPKKKLPKTGGAPKDTISKLKKALDLLDKVRIIGHENTRTGAQSNTGGKAGAGGRDISNLIREEAEGNNKVLEANKLVAEPKPKDVKYFNTYGKQVNQKQYDRVKKPRSKEQLDNRKERLLGKKPKKSD